MRLISSFLRLIQSGVIAFLALLGSLWSLFWLARFFWFMVGLGALLLIQSGCVPVINPPLVPAGPRLIALGAMAASQRGKLKASQICTHLELGLFGVDQDIAVSLAPTKAELLLALSSNGYVRLGNDYVYTGERLRQAVFETRLVRAAGLIDSVPTIDLSAGVVYSATLFTWGTPLQVSSQATRSQRRSVQSVEGEAVVETSRESVQAGLSHSFFVDNAVPGWFSVVGEYQFSAFTAGLDTRSSVTKVDVIVPVGEWVTVETISSVDVSLAASLRGIGLRLSAGADAVAVQVRVRAE